MVEPDQIKEFAGLIKSGLLAGFGGVVGYLVDVAHRGKPFRWLSYAVFVLTAFFVGQVLDDILPSDLPGKGGLLMVAGTTAYPILVVLQAKIMELIEKLK